jgi:hypothetical protein
MCRRHAASGPIARIVLLAMALSTRMDVGHLAGAGPILALPALEVRVFFWAAPPSLAEGGRNWAQILEPIAIGGE